MKHNIMCGVLSALAGIAIMIGVFFAFKYIPWRIDGDKWGVFFMFESIIGMATLFISGSFFYDAAEDKTGKGRNH